MRDLAWAIESRDWVVKGWMEGGYLDVEGVRSVCSYKDLHGCGDGGGRSSDWAK
jgi:hypothetical protein